MTATHVLWHLSSDVGVRALMHKHTPSLGKVLFGEFAVHHTYEPATCLVRK